MKATVRRILPWLAASAAVALGVWGIILCWPDGVAGGKGGQPVTDQDFSCPEPCDLYRIAWTGDTMIGDKARDLIKEHGYSWVFRHAPALLDADYAVGNSESPITNRRKRWDPDRMWAYRMKPIVASELQRVGLDAMGLANNHAFDRGPEGARDTRRHLDSVGMKIFGVGDDQDEAEAPLLIETPHGTVGVVAMESVRSAGQEALPEQAGTPRLRRQTIERAHRRAREAGARWVVAYVHWGRNYRPIVFEQKRVARLLVSTGYDLVVGHGPHIQQPVGRIDGVPVLYSLGNFVFNSPGRFQKLDKPPYGLVATTFLGPDGFEGIELKCLLADNLVTDYQPRPCTAQERSVSLSSLGPEVRVRGDIGVLTY